MLLCGAAKALTTAWDYRTNEKTIISSVYWVSIQSHQRFHQLSSTDNLWERKFKIFYYAVFIGHWEILCVLIKLYDQHDHISRILFRDKTRWQRSGACHQVKNRQSVELINASYEKTLIFDLLSPTSRKGPWHVFRNITLGQSKKI